MVKHSFAKGPEGWASYDYHASVIAGAEIFVMSTWEKEGGINGGSYIWSDHHRWSADTPENPVSILAFIRYRQWFNEDPIDLRGAELSCSLRGDGLNINTAKCYFWAHVPGNRWHCHAQPITVSQGKWADKSTVLTLNADPAQWYRSWPALVPRTPLESKDSAKNDTTVLTLNADPAQWYRSWLNPSIPEVSLEQGLAGVQSYGFSFVGFGSEVSGRLALGEFAINTR